MQDVRLLGVTDTMQFLWILFFSPLPQLSFLPRDTQCKSKISETQKICENLSKLKGEKALPSGICYLVTQSTMYIMGKQERTFQF